MNDKYLQKDAIFWIENNLGSDVMIPVHGNQFICDSDVYIKPYLIPTDRIEDEMEDDNLNHYIDSMLPGFTQYGNGEVVYLRFGNDEGLEPLICEYYFDGLAEKQTELIEEFRQLFELYYDRNNGRYINPRKDNEVVCKIGNPDTFTTIRKSYLKSYLAAKRLVLILFIDSRIMENDGGKKYSAYASQYCREDGSLLYSLTIGNYDNKNYSQIYAKKVIRGCALEDCGIRPYDKKKEYIDFIIGTDEEGREIKHSCDPATLSNYFGANPGEPHYLTPVYFQKSVLEKYHNQPERYTIEPGILRCGGLWSLYIDNESEDYVSAYLGDLGRDLPSVEEQHYWRGYNKVIDGHLSKAKIDMDFNVKFATSEAEDAIFKSKFSMVNKRFADEIGWPLFLTLDERDEYNFTTLRIPLRESQVEFDSLVLALVKVMIDSLNEKEINKMISSTSTGGISRLETWLSEKGLSDYDVHVKFLRNLQELRSTGTGHRKGKSYDKMSKTFGINGNNFKEVYAKILRDATLFLEYINENVDNLK